MAGRVLKVALGAAAAAGLLYLAVRPKAARAAPGAPGNFKIVDGKFQALGLAAAFQGGSPAVIVVSDAAHRLKVTSVLVGVARKNPGVDFYFALKDFVIGLVPEDVELPEDLESMWGGVGAIVAAGLPVDHVWKNDVSNDEINLDIEHAVSVVFGSLEAVSPQEPVDSLVTLLLGAR